jgi:hypothetical protein
LAQAEAASRLGLIQALGAAMQPGRAKWHRIGVPARKWWHLLRDWALELVVHAEELPGLGVPRFRYIWALDDFDCLLVYQGYAIDLEMDWEGEFSLVAAEAVPDDVFDFVCRHFDTFEGVPQLKVRRLKARYLRPAKTTWLEK